MAEQDESAEQVRRTKPGGIRGSQEQQEPEQDKPDPKTKPTTQSAKRGNSASK